MTASVLPHTRPISALPAGRALSPVPAACANAAVVSCYLRHLCSFWPESIGFVLVHEAECEGVGVRDFIGTSGLACTHNGSRQ